MPPICLYIPIHSYTPIHLYTHNACHMFKHPHMFPMLPCAPVCSRGYLHVIWGCGALQNVWTAPGGVDASPVFQHPPHCMLPCKPPCFRASMHVLWGNYPLCLGVWGCQHICQAFGVCQYINWMPIMLHLVPFL